MDSTQRELERFRDEWRAEVAAKRKAAASEPAETSQPVSSAPAASSSSPRASSPVQRRGPTVDTSKKPLSPDGPQHVGALHHVTNAMRAALDAYKEAVDYETNGDLDNALQSYRRAFRLDSNVDKAYNLAMINQPSPFTLHALKAALPRSPTTSKAHAHPIPPTGSEPTSKHLSQHHDSMSLASAVMSFSPDPVIFAPEDEEAPVPIANVPEEVVVLILRQFARHCDYTSIERFAVVNRKARLLSMETALWRDMVVQLIQYPQIPKELPIPEIVKEEYENDYRRALIVHPRLRFDGVYIAVCHYVRPGSDDNPWINVTHLITYHRYLRFLPNGTVLSLLANDEKPSEIIHILEPSLRRKGFHVGTWSLEGTSVIVRDLMDPSGETLARYAFEMLLDLKSKPLGRWNKLDLSQYNTIRLDTGDAEALSLKHERPFWFSKVKSYASRPDSTYNAGLGLGGEIDKRPNFISAAA